MKILDCTLRDGGFVNDFDWDLRFAKRYLEFMSRIKVPIVELGYWKQNSKSKNRFYNFNEDTLDQIYNGVSTPLDMSIMIDYHYCSKKISDYPKNGTTPINLVRITSRKEDLPKALKFAETLKNKTNLDMAFQIINSTNYTRKELLKTTEIIAKHDFLYVYFADSHGNLNLNENYDNYRDSVEALRFNGKKVGFHLHNHTGRALMNYYFCKNNNIDIVDATISGLGKGLGNLKLEEIISNEYFPDLIDFIIKNNQHLGDIHLNPYNLISGRANITDNYAKQALKFNPSMSCFNKFVNSLRGRARDSFDSELLKIYMDKQ